MDSAYLQRFLSDSARKATRSEIRELLKLIARPEIISLAGGLPSPETFPAAAIGEIAARALSGDGVAALQYGTTEGDPGLKEQLIRWLAVEEGDGTFAITVVAWSSVRRVSMRRLADLPRELRG